jgi:hypothetical protein
LKVLTQPKIIATGLALTYGRSSKRKIIQTLV